MQTKVAVRWLGMLGIALFSVAAPMLATIGPPPNQCPGDCSPCLGDNDPFCDSGPGGVPPQSSAQCQTCVATNEGGIFRVGCAFVGTGEAGHLTCSTTTDKTGKTTCTASGTSCTGVSNP